MVVLYNLMICYLRFTHSPTEPSLSDPDGGHYRGLKHLRLKETEAREVGNSEAFWPLRNLQLQQTLKNSPTCFSVFLIQKATLFARPDTFLCVSLQESRLSQDIKEGEGCGKGEHVKKKKISE